MMQTRSRHRAPMLNAAQLADLVRELPPAAPAPECRIHPDDWEEILRAIHGKPQDRAPRSVFVDVGFSTSTFTEVSIILDENAPRLARIDARPMSVGSGS